MSEAVDERGEQWSGHRFAAALVRLVVWLARIAITVLTTHFLSDALPRPSGWVETAVWWMVLSGLATFVLFVSDRLARRLLPLAALLKLSLVFPDRAPSRYKAALRTGTVHQLEQRVLDIKHNGLPDDPTLAAEALIELIAALSAHDRMTRGHAERVRAYSRMIGEELKLDPDDLDRLQWAGLLHDVGKLFVPSEILNKDGKLTDEEFEVIKQHPGRGAALCEPLRGWLGDWVDAVGEHHERWDGLGYPAGTANEDISFAARIVSVADVYDVITSVRSYKPAQGAVDGRAELARCAGTQFDPRIVRTFLNISLGRLRLVMGPLSWLSQAPLIGRVPVGATAGAAVSGAAAAVTLVAGGLLDRPADRDTVVEAAEPVVVVTSTSTTTTSIAEPVVITQPPIANTTLAPPVTLADPAPTTTELATTTTITTTTTTAPVTVAPTTRPPVTSPPATTPPTATAPVTVAPATTTTTTIAPAAPGVSAGDDQMTMAEDAPATFDVGANDQHWVGTPTAAQPSHGHVVVAGPGRLTYLPAPDWFGVDSFAYTVGDAAGGSDTAIVTVTVQPVPDDPQPGADAAAVDEDQFVNLTVLANDVDADGETLTVTSVVSTTGSAVTDGTTVTYTPPPDVNGPHSFTYTVTDRSGSTATASAAITVNPVPDAPVAGDDAASVDEDQSVAVAVLANDTDADSEALVVSAAASLDGSATTDGATVFYTPAANASGSHVVEYTVTDGAGATDTAAVTVNVTPVPDTPVAADDSGTVAEDNPVVLAVLGNDADADGEPLTITTVGASDGVATTDGDTITFTPPSDASGAYTITYTVDDGTGATATATVTVTVTPVSDPPVAADDAYTVFVDQPLNIAAPGLLSNDSDEDGDPLTAALVSGPTSGSLTVNADGSFDYTPATGFVGTATFVYAATDTAADDDLATVVIEVSDTTVPVAFYLGTSGTNADNWSLQPSPNPVANPEPDHDGDGDPGLTIDDSSMSLSDTDGDEYQNWNMVVASPLVLRGPAALDLWSSAKGFNTGHDLDYTIWLMDCAANGTGCTTVAFVDDVHVNNWNSGTPNFVRRTIGIGAVDHTVATGRMLRLRLMFHHHDAWVALSGSRATQLILTQPA